MQGLSAHFLQKALRNVAFREEACQLESLSATARGKGFAERINSCIVLACREFRRD